MSQDQVWHLLLGLALVKHFVDAPDLFEDAPGEYFTLKEIAKRITYRILHYMQASYQSFGLGDEPLWNWCHIDDNCYPGEWGFNTWSTAAWRVKNPCTGDTVFRGGSVIDLFPFVQLFEDAGNWITDLEWGDFDYGLGGSSGIPLPYSPNWYNHVGCLVLATIGNSIYADSLNVLFWNIRKCADLYSAFIPGNPHDLKYFWLDHLPLISTLLHGVYRDRPFFDYFFSHVESLLDEAPINGPERYENPPPNYLWSQNSMLRKPIGLSIESTRTDLFGKYSGIDYMLLFNLYHLAHYECFKRPVIIDYDFPTTYTYLYSSDYSYGDGTINIGHEDDEVVLTINSKSTITMNSTVQSDGKVHLRGREIVLNPGFEVVAGGDFQASTNKSMDLDFSPQ